MKQKHQDRMSYFRNFLKNCVVCKTGKKGQCILCPLIRELLGYIEFLEQMIVDLCEEKRIITINETPLGELRDRLDYSKKLFDKMERLLSWLDYNVANNNPGLSQEEIELHKEIREFLK